MFLKQRKRGSSQTDQATAVFKQGAALTRRGVSSCMLGASAGVLAGAVMPAQARTTITPPRADDEKFMRIALAEAARGDFPFGAVIEKDGAVLATGRNSGAKLNDPTAHGEMMAIRHFTATRPARELTATTLYTSGEPCPMCMGAIIWCGFRRVVYAASIEQLSAKIGQIMLPSVEIARAAPFAQLEITGGVMATEALALFDRPQQR